MLHPCIAEGNSCHDDVKFDLCFGGRRQFCDEEYADLGMYMSYFYAIAGYHWTPEKHLDGQIVNAPDCESLQILLHNTG